MEHLLNDHEDHLSQLCDEKEHLFLSLKESQWKLRQQHGSEFQEGEKSTVQQIIVSEEIKNPKEHGCMSYSQGSEQENKPYE